MSKKFERQKQAIFTKYEREHNKKVPERLRSYVLNELLTEGHGEEVDLKDLEDTIPSYMGACEIYASYLYEKAKHPTESTPENGSQKRTYRRPLEKRLYLAEFVSEKVLNFHNLISHSFTPHKRIGWKELAVLWNKKHPYNTMTPDCLRTEFYRIIRDNAVQREFFDRRDKEFAQFAAKEFREEAANFAKAMYEASREHGLDFNFTQGEPIEIRWLVKQLGPPPADEWKRNYMSTLIHNSIEVAKAKLSKRRSSLTGKS